MFFHSIRWRLQLWHGFLLLGVLASFGFTAHRFQRASELRRVDRELEHRVSVLLQVLRESSRRPGPDEPPPRERRGGRPEDREPPGEGPPRSAVFRFSAAQAELFGGPGNETFYYVLWRRDGPELGRSTNAPSLVDLPERTDAAAGPYASRQRGLLRESFRFTPPGECVLVGRSIAPELAALHQFALGLTGLGAGVLAFGLAGGWWLTTRAIRPIHDISAAASRISAGNLSERISAAETDNELGKLAGVLNSTFTRLEAAFAQQQQFTADASHELRTPISVILTQVQTALARERPAADYRATLEACQRAAQRMRQLTESLLALARLDAGHEPVRRERFDLARAVRECLDLVRPLADERRVTLHAELGAAECLGDPERVAQVITNLLTNAIQHSPDAGEVRVRTGVENDRAVLTVTDQGAGVPPEALEKIFERFYRVDDSRHRRTGGVGLGLAIVKSCVEVCGGSVAAANVEPHGLQMTVRLPAAPEK